jgi:hypothetical protein
VHVLSHFVTKNGVFTRFQVLVPRHGQATWARALGRHFFTSLVPAMPWASPGSNTWPGTCGRTPWPPRPHKGSTATGGTAHIPNVRPHDSPGSTNKARHLGAGPGRTLLHQLSTCNALGGSPDLPVFCPARLRPRQPWEGGPQTATPTIQAFLPGQVTAEATLGRWATDGHAYNPGFFARPGYGRGNPGKVGHRRPRLQSRLFARPGYGRGNPGKAGHKRPHLQSRLFFLPGQVTAEATLGGPGDLHFFGLSVKAMLHGLSVRASHTCGPNSAHG